MPTKIHIIDDRATISRMAQLDSAMAEIEGKDRIPMSESSDDGAFDLVLSDVDASLDGSLASTMTLEVPGSHP